MQKSISINKNFKLSVILNEEHVFLISLSYLLKQVDVYTKKNMDAYGNMIKRTTSYAEGTDFVKHKKGDTVYNINIKPGSIYLTRLGLIKFCSFIDNSYSKDIATWAMSATANNMEGKEIKEIATLFSSILIDVCLVEDMNIRNSLTRKLKLLENKLY